jgi:hypothetical protein
VIDNKICKKKPRLKDAKKDFIAVGKSSKDEFRKDYFE